ncbi:hypothetical protein [Nonomuraea endophytica]|uniref:hypothetical protein n=1 Tax=Nonomuraea endophytica TaxID=714136 RepID=UPI0037CC4499
MAPPPRPLHIDWGATAHPSASGLPQLELVSFTIAHPEPDALVADLKAVGATAEVVAGESVALRAVLATPEGPVTLA